jgi:cellulose synthase (UDP-forming)
VPYIDAVTLAPLALVIAGHLLFRHTLKWRLGITLTTWAAVFYYLHWRLTVTMPWDESGWRFGWPAICLFIEIVSLFDAAILYLALTRRADRSGEADAGEARLRAAPPATLPVVDVFIATYNEPREVLEKTILGCLALDWPDARVWVLDDGRRTWLRDYCEAKGAGYITRPDNKGAKAGNINHALSVTGAAFVAVFDADFIPRRDFLMRTMGFFDDPKIGIVQVPHSFYNHDPMQSNLSLRGSMPDDQRFFFEAIMPGRDAWDGAFCCGSNSVTRRQLFDDIGGGLPEGSITEDMLLTLASLRNGYITRYLNEPLAHGLAPESVAAFFVQRQRWAQGGIQILHLKEGPLGPGIGLIHRLLFLPTSWISQSLMTIFSFITPIVFMWLNLPPLVGVDLAGVIHYALPMMVGLVGGITMLAAGRYFPAASHILGCFQSFRILPVAIQTLFRPKGLIFKVTPKGSAAAGAGWETGIWFTASLLIALTVAGLGFNAHPDFRIIDEQALMPIMVFWGTLNVIVLLLVAMMCLQKSPMRAEERFPLASEVTIFTEAGDWFATAGGDMSLSGLGVGLRPEAPAFGIGDQVKVAIAGVGAVGGKVVRARGRLGVVFEFADDAERDRLIVHLFTGRIEQNVLRPSAWQVTAAILGRLWSADLTDDGHVIDGAPEDGRKLDPASRAVEGRWAPTPLPAPGRALPTAAAADRAAA